MAYSVDLRNRVVSAYQQKKGSLEQMAHRFLVSPSSVSRWVGTTKRGEPLSAKHSPGRNRVIKDPEKIKRLWDEDPDAFQHEIAARYQEQEGKTVSRATIGRTKQRMGWSRKKRASSPVSKTQSA